MQLLHLLSLTLLTVLSEQAGYFPSFTNINKDQLLTPKSATLVAGGLGIYGLGYCVKDLWKVSNALYRGDEAIAAFKRIELIYQNEGLSSLCYLLEKEFTESVSHTNVPPRLDQMNLSLARLDKDMRIDLAAMSTANGVDHCRVDDYWQNNFIPQRNAAIAQIKNEFKWRAFYDVSAIAAISAVGYGAYTLINK